MNKIISLAMALLPFLCFSQEDFTLKGKISNLDKPAKIFILYQDGGKKVTDSVYFNKGAFTYHGRVSEPVKASLILAPDGEDLGVMEVVTTANSGFIFLSRGNLQIEGNDLATAKISGNKINEDFQKYMQSLTSLKAALSALEDELIALNTQENEDKEERITALEEKFKSLYAQQRELGKDFIKQNPNSYVSLSLLSEYISPTDLYEYGLPAFEGLSNSMRSSKKGKELAKKIDQLKTLANGAQAPEISLQDTSGNTIKLSSFKGKYVLVDFWASWCVPCRHENPYVVAAFNKYKSQNFMILGVSLDNSKEKWLEAIQQDELGQWPHISDLLGWRSIVTTTYSIRSIPQNYLIDPEGKIIASNLRGEALEKKLAEILD